MPGIYDGKPSAEETPMEQGDESNEQSSPDDENQQQPGSEPKELDQTDKINKFLLKSFLQHINNNPINVPAPNEPNGDVSADEWKAWSIKESAIESI